MKYFPDYLSSVNLTHMKLFLTLIFVLLCTPLWAEENCKFTEDGIWSCFSSIKNERSESRHKACMVGKDIWDKDEERFIFGYDKADLRVIQVTKLEENLKTERDLECANAKTDFDQKNCAVEEPDILMTIWSSLDNFVAETKLLSEPPSPPIKLYGHFWYTGSGFCARENLHFPAWGVDFWSNGCDRDYSGQPAEYVSNFTCSSDECDDWGYFCIPVKGKDAE